MAKRRIPDLKLLRRARKAEVASLAALLGTEAIREFGKLVLVHAPGTSIGNVPRILGAARGTREAIPEAIEAIDPEARIACRIEVAPGELDPSLAATLDGLGFVQTDFRAVLYGNPADATARDSAMPDNDGLEVAAVDTDSGLAEFVQIHHEGWDVPEASRAEPGAFAHWREVAELYVSRLHGTSIGAAVLHRVDTTAHLGPSASTHVLRRQGGHIGLIRRRLARAAELGCDLVFAHAPFDSPAHRNLQNAGLSLAATPAVWTVRATSDGSTLPPNL